MADDAQFPGGSAVLKGDEARSFAPIVRAGARVLVLGSVPGKASLAAQQYYAHPRNAFWKMIESLLGVGASQSYAARCDALARRGVALWDVMRSCERPSSLDADIVTATIVPNDFAGFLAAHERIRHVFFNGAKAEEVFRRRVLPLEGSLMQRLSFTRMPSTSPAHASLTLAQKIDAWRALVTALEAD